MRDVNSSLTELSEKRHNTITIKETIDATIWKNDAGSLFLENNLRASMKLPSKAATLKVEMSHAFNALVFLCQK